LGLSGLPIIAMTAHALESERQQCLAVGMNDHLAKPIDPPALLAALTRWLAPHGNAPAAGPAAIPPAPGAAPDPEFPATLPGIDLPDVLRRLSGKQELLLQLLRAFSENEAGVLETLRASLAAGDLPGACRTAHSLRGVAATLSMTNVAAAAETLEQALKRKQREEIEPCLGTLAAALSPVLAGLKRLPPKPTPTLAAVPPDRPRLER
jgi:HPt (histidine-containing phosphotransfer) domain-containing protein